MRNTRANGLRSAWFNMAIRHKGILVVSFPVLSFLLMLALFARFDDQRTLAQQWASHAEHVKLQARSVMITVLEAETGMRGFAATGDEQFLEPYLRAAVILPISLEQLKQLVTDNPLQRRRADELATLARDKFDFISRNVTLARSFRHPLTSPDRAAILDSLLQGKAAMDTFKKQTAMFLAEEQRLLEVRTETLKQKRRTLQWTILFGWFLSLVGPVVAVSLFSSGITRRLANLAENADRLAGNQPLLPMLAGKDEISRLERQLHATAAQIADRETLLRHGEARFRSLVVATCQIVWSTDAKGNVVEDSPSWRLYTGQGKEEYLGRGGFDVVHPDDREQAETAWQAAVDTQSAFEIEYRIRKHDGTYGHFATRGVPVAEGGVVREWVGSCTDITQRKLVERMKDELVATVSHELRTPLASLRGFAELMLLRDYGPQKTHEFLTIIHNESKRLTNLINNFLDLQKMQAGREVSIFEPINLSSLILESAALHVGDATHCIRLDIPADLPEVHADVEQIRRVLANLLSNALKYSPQGGDVTVAVVEKFGEVIISVSDQGLGIPAEALPQLFTKFFRADSDAHRGIAGTGLGLALVKEMVELHHGRAWVQSSPGCGSTFFFALPAKERTAKVKAMAAAASVAPADILIVEDDAPFAGLLTEHLQSLGLSVASTAYAEDALEMARVFPPRLMLVDLQLAGRMCGWELLLAVKNDPDLQSVPVAIVTISEPNVRGLALGGSDYVSKLAPPEAMIGAIHRHLSGRGKHILVVDDDPIFRRSIAELLLIEGFTVDQAENGKQALAQIQERLPDLMLLDLVMPEMDGFEVLQRLRADPQALNLPVLVITGKELSGDERHHIRRRLATFVGKREADLGYFTKIVGKVLGRELRPVIAPESQLQTVAG